jgi:hypothetical protein
MKREVFLAVAVGFVLGLIITFGVWTANNTLKNHIPGNRPPAVANVTPSPTTVPPPSSSVKQIPLTLTSPAQDETLVTTGSLTVSGKTSPDAAVALVYENGESIGTADDSGTFSFDIKLDSGYNRITATAFDKDGNTAKTQILVTYTTNKI